MRFENPTIYSEKSKSLDENWYEKLKEMEVLSDIGYLVGNKEKRTAEKNKFISGEIENPNLDYPELDKLNFEEKEQKLLTLKRNILKQEKNETIKQLYRWKINERIAIIRMLKSSKNKDDKRFSKYSEFVYGKPEKEIYEYTLFQVKKIIDENLFSSDLQKKEAARKINIELFDPLMNNENKLELKIEKSNIKSTDKETTYNAEDMKKEFEKVLEKHKITDWKIIIDEEEKITDINVFQENKTINIPKKLSLEETEFKGIIEHEIGTHVARREKGERSKLKLLGIGLDRYLKGEEGLATYAEQKLFGTSNFSGFEGHFAISLALGIDGKKRNFKEVFEILKNYYLLLSEKSQEKALKSAGNSAWSRCVRTFRGTTCQTPGACFTRDVVYREGNVGVWNVLRNDPKEAKRFSIGKYDPANPRHIWILEQLNITEEDLDSLEK